MGIHLLSIAQEQQIVVNLQEKHKIILQALGTPLIWFIHKVRCGMTVLSTDARVQLCIVHMVLSLRTLRSTRW